MSETLQYRAYFFDPDIPRPERPVQIFATDLAHIQEWAKQKLNNSGPHAEVWLYEMKEVLIGSWVIPPKKDECVKTTKPQQPKFKKEREKNENGD
jgi:hypothetical protein